MNDMIFEMILIGEFSAGKVSEEQFSSHAVNFISSCNTDLLRGK
jgi:hypothetical protein